MFSRGVAPKLMCGPSRVHTSFAKSADINVIMHRYQKTGILVDPRYSSERVPRFGDFSDIPDYDVLLSRMNQAQADFLTLPSEVRAKFDNDVAKCLDYISDPDNLESCVDMALLPKTHPAYVKLLKDREAADLAAAGQAGGASV